MTLPAILETFRQILVGHPVTQGFGCTGYSAEPHIGVPGTSTYCAHFHTGVDFAVPSGIDLYSVGKGTVIVAGNYGGYGNTVIVQLDNYYRVLYGHLSSVAVTPNERVNIGDRIGLSGSTGNSSGPHLHLELRDPYNEPVDIQQGIGGNNFSKVWQVLRNVGRWASAGGSPDLLTQPLKAYNLGTGAVTLIQPSTINDPGNGQPDPGSTTPCGPWFTLPAPFNVDVPNPYCLLGQYISSQVVNAELNVIPVMIVLVAGIGLTIAGIHRLGNEKPVQSAVNVAVSPVVATKNVALKAGESAAKVAAIVK